MLQERRTTVSEQTLYLDSARLTIVSLKSSEPDFNNQVFSIIASLRNRHAHSLFLDTAPEDTGTLQSRTRKAVKDSPLKILEAT